MFAREFFLPQHRSDLPKVPACSACNNRKASLEHYALTVLPLGGRHTHAMANAQNMLPKRLERNARLLRHIRSGIRPVIMQRDSGLLVRANVLPIDGDQIEELFSFIGRGLLWHHFGVLLAEDDEAIAKTLTAPNAEYFERELFARAGQHLLTCALGEDTVVYEGFQTPDCLQGSAWMIRMYGGLVFAASGPAKDSVASTIGVLTGPVKLESAGVGLDRS